ncbi:alkyl sulfatase dimerization domain-containing protein [Rhodoferax sp.]|uniref:alkyl sulfatase dimerization domain-containing protein n=1 Tax=Rhodoferax sp. TaxID=50421 RepID=UPI00273027E3|nr:alkyl sulfatase dimerization domain-containing protein [Rhodoferax sp.]MDP2443760.1 alkyl sulfatase dimerization domain-containing protein [Rhodoferax sp.]MDZ4207781.1 alkyl sulfatase dimerization domain-containing protein [Rhodoferax sp.]
MAHNVAAIYAHYLGPYDGNPVHLNPLPPQAAGSKYVEYMGGAQQVIDRARRDFDSGEFRWVIEAMKHVIFREPDNAAARELLSRRNSAAPTSIPISPDIVSLLPHRGFREYMAIRVNGTKAQDLMAHFDWHVGADNWHAGSDECQRITVSNGALNHLPGGHGDAADAVIRTERAQLAQLLLGPAELQRALDAGEMDIRGNGALFRQFVETLDSFDPMFNVIEP